MWIGVSRGSALKALNCSRVGSIEPDMEASNDDASQQCLWCHRLRPALNRACDA